LALACISTIPIPLSLCDPSLEKREEFARINARANNLGAA
jgi:hypothetical protein